MEDSVYLIAIILFVCIIIFRVVAEFDINLDYMKLKPPSNPRNYTTFMKETKQEKLLRIRKQKLKTIKNNIQISKYG